MLRQEERGQPAIHFEQALARQFDAAAASFHAAVGFKLVKALAEFVADIDAELALKIGNLQPASLELQNHLANQALAGPNRQGAVERQFVLLESTDIFFPA